MALSPFDTHASNAARQMSRGRCLNVFEPLQQKTERPQKKQKNRQQT